MAGHPDRAEIGAGRGRHDSQVARGETASYLMTRNGKTFAGMHLLVDFWDADHLDDLAFIETALCEAATAAGATVLHIHLHHFTPNGGVSGVAVLAESHISIHTWPETGFAALDIFMCGDTFPERAIPVLEKALTPGRVEQKDIRRGFAG